MRQRDSYYPCKIFVMYFYFLTTNNTMQQILFVSFVQNICAIRVLIIEYKKTSQLRG